MSVNMQNTAAAGQRAIDNCSPITFGVEIEFIGVVPEKLKRKWEFVEDYTRHKLSKTKVTLPCNKPGCKDKKHKWSLPIHKDLSHQTNDKWILTTDTSVSTDTYNSLGEGISPDLTGFDVSSMELVSRVQKFEGTSRCPLNQTYPCTNEVFEWTWQDELRCFLEAIQKIFSGPGFRAFVNKTAGLHVHLGHGDQGLPINVVKGLSGTMIALERCFDSILPASRIAGADTAKPLPGMEVNDFHALYKPGPIANYDFDRFLYQALTNVMFTRVRNNIQQAVDGLERPDARGCDTHNSPVNPHAPGSAVLSAKTQEVERHMSSFNVPAWLDLLKQKKTVQEVKDMGLEAKYIGLSLRNLGDDPRCKSQPTGEVRIHTGSLDFDEISAWVDLLCSLLGWAEATSTEEVFAHLLEAWADPSYEISDLARTVGASIKTYDHYDRMRYDDYVERRFESYTAADRNPADRLNAAVIFTEGDRRDDLARTNVKEKIRWKLESGRYGQMPISFLEKQPDSYYLLGHEARYLRLDEECQKEWIEYLKPHYTFSKGDDPRDSSSDNSGDSPGDIAGDNPGNWAGEWEDNVLGEWEDNIAGEWPNNDPSDGGVELDGSQDGESVVGGASDGSFSSSSSSSVHGNEEDEVGDEVDGYYGLHPALAAAYNSIPGQHLSHLEKTVISMPELPEATAPNMEALEELKTATCERLQNNFFRKVTAEGVAAADNKDDAERILAEYVEGTKQVHTLRNTLMEKSIALRYIKKG